MSWFRMCCNIPGHGRKWNRDDELHSDDTKRQQAGLQELQGRHGLAARAEPQRPGDGSARGEAQS